MTPGDIVEWSGAIFFAILLASIAIVIVGGIALSVWAAFNGE